jgi:hypothetical protein
MNHVVRFINAKMVVSDELGEILDGERDYVGAIKRDLAAHGDRLTSKTERDLRLGYRAKRLVDLRLERYRAGLDPVTGEARAVLPS